MNKLEKLTEFYRKAASDPRLTGEAREKAKKHDERLQAIATRK
jgi:hypothetical protein